MDGSFYSRATGRLSRPSKGAFRDTANDASSVSINTLDGDSFNESSYQRPTGCLSVSQARYVTEFLQGICGRENIHIDREVRSIHWIGFWLCAASNTIVSCSIVQPNVSNGKVHLSGVSEDTIRRHSNIYFPEGDNGKPSISTPQVNPQLSGKFAIPLADSLIEHNIMKPWSAAWNLVLLSATQPIFIVSGQGGVYECRLTHASCEVMRECAPRDVGVVGPREGSQSYTIRDRSILGSGTGPTITVHRSGTIQFQGKPCHVSSVARCFKRCIDSCMESHKSSRFVSSLSVIRHVD